MAKEYHGIIARITTAPNKIPKYWGYDLRLVHPDIQIKRDITTDDFHLIFEGMSRDKDPKFSSEKVLKNLDKTIFTLYKQEIDLGEKFEEEAAKIDKIVHNVQGQTIRTVSEVNGEFKVELMTGQSEDISETMNQIFNCWVNARAKRMELVEELSEEYRKGTLDISNDDANRLVIRDENNNPVDAPDFVSLKQIKDTIFFCCDVYKTTQEFKNKINLVHEENGYFCEIENNKFSFDKETKFSETEISVIKDLLKLNQIIGG